MKDKVISVFGSDMGELEKNNVMECLDSQWIGFGKKVDEFEKKLCEIRKFSNFVMLDSGSNALYMALILLKLPSGSEVVLPAFTWVACANAVVLAGLKPVFADVEINTMNVSAKTIKKVITKKTSCIMVVHFAGLPVDMDPIMDFGIPVIEDAAHAIYSNYKGKPCGSIGDIGVFSFDSVKNLAVGEGGGIVCKKQIHELESRDLRYCGIQKSGFESAITKNIDSKKMWWEYEIVKPFIKMLPTNISASIGLAQLERRAELQLKRKEVWDLYQVEFKDLKFIETPNLDVEFPYSHSYFTYVVKASRRDSLAKYLLNNGIYTTLRYQPLDNYSHFKQDVKNRLENSEKLSRTSLSLPLHPRLLNSEVEKVISCVKNFYK
jgi:dTDP-4-amino-4,6-dideoxygalactose transaminase